MGTHGPKAVITVGEIQSEGIENATNLIGKGGRVVVTGMNSVTNMDVKLKRDELITTRYRLEDVNQGYHDMQDGKNIRGLIEYTDADR